MANDIDDIQTVSYNKLKDSKHEQEPSCKGYLVRLTLRCLLLALLLYTNVRIALYTTAPSHREVGPQQLHLSLGANDGEYYVTWSTEEPMETYLIWQLQTEFDNKPRIEAGRRYEGIFKTTDKDQLHEQEYRKYSYRAKMANIESDSKYRYRVIGCQNGKSLSGFCRHAATILITENDDNRLKSLFDEQSPWSAEYSSNVYSFSTKRFDDPRLTLKLIFYGDLGLLNAQSVPRLTKEIEQSDLIIHNGDFAYDLDTEQGEYGDRFMRLIEPIAARIPYQTSVGNHEIAANFSEYNHRFTMINRGPINHGSMNNFFYSFNAGPIHFVAISTEFYYFLNFCGLSPLVNQYNWLIEDLERASSPEERAKRPWIVVFGHRPMYCSSRDHDDCSKESNLLRKGLPFTGAYALEKLFYDYGVDVELYSHEHQYERFLPIFNGKVYNGTGQDPYHNARAPVHVISGSAGCQEKLDPFKGTPATGSVKQISDYGYTRLKATECTLEFKQISDDQDGTVVDKFVLSKDRQNYPSVGPIYDNCKQTES